MAFYSRGKNKLQNRYSTIDMYKDYISEMESDSPYFVSKQTYLNILKEFYKKIMEKIIKDGYSFKSFSGLGIFYIFKLKMDIFNKKTIPIDWKLTQQCGKIIQNLNEHSRGFKYVFGWSKDRYAFNNKSLYKFIPTRENKRALAKAIKSGEVDYLIKEN